MDIQDSYSDEQIFKLKRKWQIALRRYVLQRSPCPAYARYFGLPIDLFREWIETQFDETVSWGTFSENWQFDHVVPLAYFNFKSEADLRLCWNFINIRVDKATVHNKNEQRIDVIAAKAYFKDLLEKTGYELCRAMIEKIEAIELSQLANHSQLRSFIMKYAAILNDIKDFTDDDMERVNAGLSVADILAERKLLAKFGR